MAENYSTVTVVFNLSTNTSVQREMCSDEVPHVGEYFTDLLEHPVELVFACLCIIVSLFTIILFITEVFSKQHKYKDPGKRLGILVLLGVYPMTATMACFAVIIPRTSVLADLIASCYFSLCLYVFIRILIQYYGSTAFMIDRLQPNQIILRSPPCCCCCCCLPKIDINSRSVKILKVMIMQTAIVQPAVCFIQAVLWANDKNIMNQRGWLSPLTYLDQLMIISILFAIYGLLLFVQASLDVLRKHKIRQKLIVLQFVLIFSNLQKAIFDNIFVRVGVPACNGPWSTSFRVSMIQHMLLVFEMGLLAILASLVYRKSDHRNISAVTLEKDVTYDTVSTSTNDIDKLMIYENGKTEVKFSLT